MMKTGVFWLREDFRIKRNNALTYATLNHENVSVVYIFKKKEFEKKREAKQWWIYKSLLNFEKDLDNLNIKLEVILSDTYESVFDKILQYKNFSIYWNKVYEPDFLKFDEKIALQLAKKNVPYKIFKGNVLNEFNEVKKNDNTPFKVFSPFWKNAEKIYLDKGFSKDSLPKKRTSKSKFLKEYSKKEDVFKPANWQDKFSEYWDPSEKEASKILKKFLSENIINYGDQRDVPSVKGTSRLSPYLASGQIHVETIWEECEKLKVKKRGYRKFINELGWREFSYSLVNYFPEILKENLRKEFDNFPWKENKKFLIAWKKGLTGYPIVDAGMRELYETGWMHNRVRMITASFLVKHLRIHWKEGEKHFQNCLVDFNSANNTAGWQWVSGCGADAAPYFRIFNPILQGEKFDKKGIYVKKWVKELQEVPEEFIHKPWEMDVKIKSFELGKHYPFPIVDHQKARESALKAFNSIKKSN